jgi:serine/threonine-protein kinase HipA
MPTDVRPRIHALSLNEADATGSMETAFEVAPRFGITADGARTIAREVGSVVRTWRAVGGRFGLLGKELDRMESAFEHRDLEMAAAIPHRR